MSKIQFIQYMRPHGHIVPRSFQTDDDTANEAEKIVLQGYHFAAEFLTTNQLSLTVEDDEQDIAVEVVSNSSEMPIAIKRLVKQAKEVLNG